MSALPKWVQRAAALLLLVAAVGVVGWGGIAPLFAYSQRLSEEIEQHAALIARFEKLAASRELYEAQLAALERRETDGSVFLPGPSDGVAAADLQQLFTTIVDDYGGDLRSTQSLAATADGPVDRISVRFILEASIDELAGILADLESRTPYVFVEALDAQVRTGRRDTADVGAEPDLLVRLDLYGYFRDALE